MSTLQDIADFAISKIGCGYVYGATGWVCSQARREQQARQYPKYASTILSICAKWDGKVCYDCAQLTKAACKAAGVTLPSGATSQWKKTAAWSGQGEISTMPEEPGIILFRQADGAMQHVEVYIGNGYTVGARSSTQGVRKFALNGYSWTHWARPDVQASATESAAESTEDTQEAATASQLDAVTGADASLKKYRVVVPEGSVRRTVRTRVAPDKHAGFAQWLNEGAVVTACEGGESASGWLYVQSGKEYGAMKAYIMTEFLQEVTS